MNEEALLEKVHELEVWQGKTDTTLQNMNCELAEQKKLLEGIHELAKSMQA